MSEDVETFVRAYFSRRASTLAEEEPGVFRASLPEALRSGFDGAEAIRLTFDPAIAAARPDVDLAVVGSFLVDRLREDAIRVGRHSACRLPLETGAAASAVESLQPRNAEASIEGTAVEGVPHLLFTFLVRLTTDERRDHVETVLIDTRTGQERRGGPRMFSAGEEVPTGASPVFDVGAGYRAACRALETRIDPHVRELRTEAGKRRDEEVERIRSYADRSRTELLGSRSDVGDELRALEFERERRTAEAEEKHRLTVEAELCSVRTVVLDVAAASLVLANRGARRALPVELDAVNTGLPPLVCEVCGTPTGEPTLCFGGHVADPACVEPCAFCDRVHCRTCVSAEGLITPCTTCARRVCPDHLQVCSLSGKPHCTDHIHACAICGRTVGPSYVAKCMYCEQSYCVACVEPPGDRCHTCRGLTDAPRADPGVAHLRTLDPALAKAGRWRRSSNPRWTVLVAKGLVWSQVFVVDARGEVVLRKKVLGG